MSHSFEEVSQFAHALPERQRILLAESLLESIGPEDEKPSAAEIDATWGEEIKRRLDEIDSGAVKMIPGKVVLAEMKARRKELLKQVAEQR
jgi:putative addiction module component (TIGR02574 family)